MLLCNERLSKRFFLTAFEYLHCMFLFCHIVLRKGLASLSLTCLPSIHLYTEYGMVSQLDRYFQPKNWQPMLKFLEGTGLRRSEVRTLTCHDVYTGMDGKLYVHVDNGKGGRPREVPVLPGREDDIRAVVAEREPGERVFVHIPGHLDVHSYRRLFAQALYLSYAPGRTLPPADGRLKRSDYDRDAAQKVSEALGHNRIDVVLRHYIR